MSTPGTVEFNYRMMTVIIEHEKRMKNTLSSEQNLSPTEFAILQSIDLSGGKTKGLSVGSFLMLKHNSISVAVSNLQRKGLLEKEINPNDRRATDLSITKKGIEITRCATKSIYAEMKKTFWEGMNDAEIKKAVLVGSYVNKNIAAGSSVHTAAFEDNVLPISPEFIVNMKVMPRMWDKTIKKNGELSTPEFRILDLLAHSDEALRSFDIAKRLQMDRAAISRSKDKLDKRGLIEIKQDAKDRRDVLLAATVQGKEFEEKINRELRVLTNELYSDLDSKEAAQMNEWHEKMYRVLLEIEQ